MKRMRSLAALRAEHESLTKGHERLVASKDRERALVCWCKANGPFLASSSFVTFCAIFVSRDFGITRRVGTWRRRRVKRSFEPGDGSALPIAEGDLPRSRVFVFRAKRQETRLGSALHADGGEFFADDKLKGVE